MTSQLPAIEAGPIIELSRRAFGDEQVPEILTTSARRASESSRSSSCSATGRPPRRWP